MPRFLLSASLCLFAASAIGQPLRDAAPPGDRQAEREQRRIELRHALQVHRQSDVLVVTPEAPAAVGRHLSARELAEMRQQLRQQQNEGKRSGP